jgi:hypothetical protein
MAYALEVLIIDKGDKTIKVAHTFYGVTEREVLTYKREHLQSCEYFRAAEKDGRVIEELERIDEEDLPDPDDYAEDEEEEEEEAS